MSSTDFVFYRLELRLISEMLGTCTEASIYNEHVLKKAQKMIKKANNLQGKITKELEKFQHTDPIPSNKEIEELRGIVRQQHEILAKTNCLPDNVDELLTYSQKLQEEIETELGSKEQVQPTIFMRNPHGKPMISTHMIIGNLKENLKISVNNSTVAKEQKLVKSKVAVGEMMALDVKPIEEFMDASKDVVRNAAGKADILERPIIFDQMGKKVTSIARSEHLPKDTEFTCHLRIRADSPFAEHDALLLRKILNFGKSNGMGRWRGSGNKGQFVYKLNQVDNDPTEIPDGWD